MKSTLAIHARPGSFSDRWIEICKSLSLDYKIVDCHASDIMRQLDGCAALLWHFSHSRAEDGLVAHSIIKSAEKMGLATYPNDATSWHFDDKVAQKYLLESIAAPCIPSYVFLRRDDAMRWASEACYPKVFKLRGGAGSSNVRLVHNKRSAQALISRAFSSGFAPYSRWQPLDERWWQLKRDRDVRSVLGLARGIGRTLMPNPARARLPRQSNYAYFQDFVPHNDHDIRIVVVGSRAFGIKRLNREGDFRASGSGISSLDPAHIPITCVDLAFKIAAKLHTQSLAMDFIFLDGKPLIVEMSYAFVTRSYPGYWSPDLRWTARPSRAEDLILDGVLAQIRGTSSCI